MGPGNLAARLQGQIARNLASLQKHRPDVYRALVQAPQNDAYTLVAGKGGQATVQFKRADGTSIVLSPGHDPAASVRGILSQLADLHARGEAFLLSGIGDGYLLATLAKNPPKLFLGMQQVIYLIEPDPSLLWSIFMIHDLTGPTGPIEQARVQWHVGPEWLGTLKRDLFADFLLPFPITTVRQSLSSAEIDRRLKVLLMEIGQEDARLKACVDQRAASMDRATVASLLNRASDRSPRVLLLTTRFSTVLQYSTRDSADALQAIGCDVRTLIEATDYQRLTRPAIRKALAEFEPDLVFQIDHLRHEHGDLFPAEIPFVCWVQDNLPNLTNSAAAARVGATDFVLTPSVERYSKTYGYPRKQSLEFRKLTRVKSAIASADASGPDLAYVSNWSQDPETLAAQHVREGSARLDGKFIADVCQRMIGVYASGQSLPTAGDVRRLVENVRVENGIPPLDIAVRESFEHALCERLNNCLYRQQGLLWASEIADALGLRLEIYGNGWEKHPRFAAHARGTIGYGQPLEELTRRARINLVLEPFVCIAHQRLLDGLAASGFFVVRRHPATILIHDTLQLLQTAGGAPGNASQLGAALDESNHAKLQRIIAAFDAQDAAPGRIDAISTIADLRSSHLGSNGATLLRDLDRVSFSTRDEMRQTIHRWMTSAPERRTTIEQLRKQIVARFSYEAGMQTMLKWIAAQLIEGSTERHIASTR